MYFITYTTIERVIFVVSSCLPYGALEFKFCDHVKTAKSTKIFPPEITRCTVI